MPVGADAIAVAALPEVHGAILVAQDRVLDLDGRARELRQRLGPCEEVLHRLHRDQRQAERAHELRRPEAQRDERRRRGDRALVGLDRAHAAAGHVDARGARRADERRAARLGALVQRLADVRALGDAVARHPERAAASSRSAAGCGAEASSGPMTWPRGPTRWQRHAGAGARRAARARWRPRASRPPTRCAARACRARGRARATTERACRRASSRWSGSTGRERGTRSRPCRRSGPGRSRRRCAHRRA